MLKSREILLIAVKYVVVYKILQLKRPSADDNEVDFTSGIASGVQSGKVRRPGTRKGPVPSRIE